MHIGQFCSHVFQDPDMSATYVFQKNWSSGNFFGKFQISCIPDIVSITVASHLMSLFYTEASLRTKMSHVQDQIQL